MGHGNMHNSKRDPQPQRTDVDGLSTIFPTAITGPGATDAATATGIISAGRDTQSVLTTIVSTYELAITQPATTLTSTGLRTILVTDTASYSALLASESSANAQKTSSASKTEQSAAETSKASKSSSSGNLGTLIPAIVVPVAAVLIISFVVFWFMMRRRHKKQLKEEPEFVMASKPEKPISRGNSNSSGTSSTRELVPLSKLEKEVAITSSEVKRSSIDLFPPNYSSANIGVARPMTPPDKAGANAKKAFTNFSSVRPNTSGRAAPGSDDIRGNGNHSRSVSSPRSGLSPRASSRNGPSPTMGRPTGHPARPARPEEATLRPGARSPPRTGPGQLTTTMANGNRAPPPQALSPPTPTGAFNGASPISQYSPIVKGMPNLGAVAATNGTEKRGQHSPLITSNLPKSESLDSPADDNVLSHENMRIARLANSSRLGFNRSPVEPHHPTYPSSGNKGLSPLTEKDARTEAPATSPRLPPPLTRDDMPPRPFARGPDSPAGGSSIYPSPSIGAGASPQLPQLSGGLSSFSFNNDENGSIGMASSTALHQSHHQTRASVVSQISTDDGYEDMDAKSDVSSLDERTKWEVETERREASSRLGTGYAGSGYGSTSMSPIEPAATTSSASTGVSKPNMRDRDSEGPFVLSRY